VLEPRIGRGAEPDGAGASGGRAVVGDAAGAR
jgi:hypothetical protein